MHKSSFIIAVAITALTIMAWALYNRPETEPAWPERIQGFAFSPFRAGQDPVSNRYPSVEEIEADIALLENRVHAIRTYTVESTMAELPRLDLVHMPGWAGDYARAIAADTETPPELAAGMVLVVCATAAARRLRVMVKPGYFEPCNLWIVVALPPGNRKSAVQSATTTPLKSPASTFIYRFVYQDALRVNWSSLPVDSPTQRPSPILSTSVLPSPLKSPQVAP